MSNEKPEYTLVPQDGELQPFGKIPVITAEQVNALAVIKSVSKIDVLANADETAKGVIALKASYAIIVENAKAEIANAKTKAEFERSKEHRLSIRSERLGFTKNIDAELSARKLIYDSAKKGKVKVEDAFKSLELELDAAEKPVDERLEAAAAAKKALSEAIAKLKSHVIDPLLPSTTIEIVIDDFVIDFGNADYGDLQADAESIFWIKKSQFDKILSAARVREENERKVKKQEEQARQRANINVTFPLADISCYGHNGTSEEIKTAIVLINKIDMTAFDLVLSEAETAKQSCLNMLNAFLKIALEKKEKEAAEKAEENRVTEIKGIIKFIADRPSDFIGKPSADILQALKIAKEEGLSSVWDGDFAEFKNEVELTLKDAIERLEIILDGTLKKEYQDDWDLAILQYTTWCENKAFEQKHEVDDPASENYVERMRQYDVSIDEDSKAYLESELEVESTIIAEVTDNENEAAFVDVVENHCNQDGATKPLLSAVVAVSWAATLPQISNSTHGYYEGLNVDNTDEYEVLIPIGHLKALIYAAEQGAKHCGLDDDEDTSNAIEYAKSLI